MVSLPIGLPSAVVAAACDGFTATYYSDKTFTNAVEDRCEPRIDIDFGAGHPPYSGLDDSHNDNFSVRWEGSFQWDAARNDWGVAVRGHGTVSVYVDGTKVIDRPSDEAQNSSATKELSTGTHTLKVEFIESAGTASILVSWGRPSKPRNVAGSAGQLKARVTWDPPVEGDAGLTGYSVRTSPATQEWPAGTGSTSLTISGLRANKPYRFMVKANWLAGVGDWTSLSPAVKVEPLVTTLLDPLPSRPSNSRRASFFFKAGLSDGVTFRCSLSTKGAKTVSSSCTSPTTYTGLAQGPHTFTVRAYHKASNQQQNPPTQFRWTVDAAPPTSTITRGPGDPTTARRATFEFTANESGSTFQCSRDGSSWKTCKAPYRTPTLKLGTHTFKVRALDPARNVGAADSYRWRIVCGGGASDSDGDGDCDCPSGYYWNGNQCVEGVPD